MIDAVQNPGSPAEIDDHRSCHSREASSRRKRGVVSASLSSELLRDEMIRAFRSYGMSPATTCAATVDTVLLPLDMLSAKGLWAESSFFRIDFLVTVFSQIGAIQILHVS